MVQTMYSPTSNSMLSFPQNILMITLYTWRQFAPVPPNRCHNTFMIIAHSLLQIQMTRERMNDGKISTNSKNRWDGGENSASAPTSFWSPGQCPPSRNHEGPMAHHSWHQEPAVKKKKTLVYPNKSKKFQNTDTRKIQVFKFESRAQNPGKKKTNLLLDFRNLEHLEVHLPLSS